MKTLVALLLSAGLGFAAAFFYVSQQKDAQHRQAQAELQARLDAEKGKAVAKPARSQPARVEQVTTTIEVPVATKASPKEFLDKLVHLKPGAGNARYQNIRQIIHQLESLADAGPASLPHIRAFLLQNQDISYEREEENQNRGETNNPAGSPAPTPAPGGGDTRTRTFGGGGGPGGPGGGGFGGFGGGDPRGGFGNLPRLEYYYPYSLRLGLFSVVNQIGGPAAEAILLEQLASTGRGVEVAALAQLLEAAAPAKHREAALAYAKELLANPIKVPAPTRLDSASESFLYKVLLDFNDTSFAPTAQAMLVKAEGRLDRGAMSYLTAALKEQAVPAFYQAYRNPQLTNQMDKASLVSSTMAYAGLNPTANQLLREIVANEQAGNSRGWVVSRLDNGELSPQVIQARIPLLESMKSGIQDERLLESLNRTLQNLQNKLNPAAATKGGPGGPGGDGRGTKRGRP